jgi:hypothetical protein
MPRKAKQIDTSAQVELTSDVQSKFTACYREARKTQTSLDRTEAKADKGWRTTLFELAQTCESAAQFKGFCDAASHAVKGEKPKVWTQAQSDIFNAWDKYGLVPAEATSHEGLRRAKIDASKAAREEENQAEQDKAEQNPVKIKIPEALAPELDALVRLVAASDESLTDEYKAILATAIDGMIQARNRKVDEKKAA